MKSPNDNHAAKSERTLITSLLFSAPGPFITLFAALNSLLATQIADFLRRTAELAASFVSWLVFRKLRRSDSPDKGYTLRLERIADRTVACAMICSGAVLCAVGMLRLFSDMQARTSVLGLVTAALGLVADTIFWIRYARLTKERYSSVLAAQRRLYRTKASVDLCVTVALAAALIAPAHPITKYIDALGSIAVAAYLLASGISGLRNMMQNRA